MILDYFLLSSSFNVLEFLVRKFNINSNNVTIWLTSILPYHTTNEFLQVVQICHTESTPFEFIVKMKNSGKPMPRRLLVRRCCNDKALFWIVYDHAKSISGYYHSSKTYLSFYTVFIKLSLLNKIN